MFSEALREMDRNTEKYMIEQWQEQIKELSNDVTKLNTMIAQKESVIAEKESLISENQKKDVEIAELRKLLAER